MHHLMLNISCSIVRHMCRTLSICDIICEKVPYRGTNSVMLDPLFQAFVIVFMVKTALVLFRCNGKFVTKTTLSL